MSAKDQALQATEALISELEDQLEDARAARRRLSGEFDPPSPDDTPKDKPEAILRVLRISGQDALTADAIWGALDTRGWLTDSDRHDNRKHFHKTLQKLYERGTLIKPRRGMYALKDKLPTYTYADPALGNGAVEEAILEET